MILALVAAPFAYGADPQIFEPPSKPSAPPSLTKKAPKDVFTCTRYFSYHGKILSCDSQLHRDGEGLRSVIQDVPPAVNELNTYQSTRRGLQTTAYVGSIGMFLLLQSLIAGGLISNLFFKETDANGNKSISNAGQEFNRISRVGGAMIAVGSVTYGLTVLHRNEQHLDNAVHFYNDVHPDNPIELKVSAGF